MWSGPRNLSTAMMYSFAARGDCRVVDEPFYAAYLAQTSVDHPMREDVLRTQDQDPDRVSKTLISPVSEPVFYQKHMTHHMLDEWSTEWMNHVTHVFLIRHPARVVASYARKREAPLFEDLGFAQQARIFDQLGGGIVVDSSDIRADPAGMLQTLCNALCISWTERMLSWPAGGHPDDGMWAAHWYNAVHASTGFDEAEEPLPELAGKYADLVDAAMPYYEALATQKIT
ncbi:HAD family hydrolase [Tateyamaria sp. syn59]|uniref:sulfotransferase-like domain-containing protein n=1 Tax=Tateyamaria sp. syn59 TaxID=2576942 RepID=UPI00167B3B15|nr:HAD family hydrolase [Tateyamaria sp. syn59]